MNHPRIKINREQENKIGKAGRIYALVFVLSVLLILVGFWFLPDIFPYLSPTNSFILGAIALTLVAFLLSHLRNAARISVLEKQAQIQNALLKFMHDKKYGEIDGINPYLKSSSSPVRYSMDSSEPPQNTVDSPAPPLRNTENTLQDNAVKGAEEAKPINQSQNQPEKKVDHFDKLHSKNNSNGEKRDPPPAQENSNLPNNNPSLYSADANKADSEIQPNKELPPTIDNELRSADLSGNKNYTPLNIMYQLRIEPIIDLHKKLTSYHHLIAQIKINDEVITVTPHYKHEEGLKKYIQKAFFSSIHTINSSPLFTKRLCMLDIPDDLAYQKSFIGSVVPILGMQNLAQRVIIALPSGYFSRNAPEGVEALFKLQNLGFKFAVRITEPINFELSKLANNSCHLAIFDNQHPAWNLSSKENAANFDITIDELKNNKIKLIITNIRNESQQVSLTGKGFDFASGSIYGPPEQLSLKKS